MNLTLPIVLACIGGTLLIIAVRSLRAHRLKERYAILFGALGVPFVGLAVWPDAVGALSIWLGIEYPTMLLLAVTVFFLLVNFKLLSIVSVQDRKLATLSQAVGILLAEKDQHAAKED